MQPQNFERLVQRLFQDSNTVLSCLQATPEIPTVIRIPQDDPRLHPDSSPTFAPPAWRPEPQTQPPTQPTDTVCLLTPAGRQRAIDSNLVYTPTGFDRFLFWNK